MRCRDFPAAHFLFLLEPIAHPAEGDDPVAVRDDGTADMLDMGVQGAGVSGELPAPDDVQQALAGEGHVRVAHQHGEQVELPGRQVDLAAVHLHPPGSQVQHQPAAAEHLRLLRGQLPSHSR